MRLKREHVTSDDRTCASGWLRRVATRHGHGWRIVFLLAPLCGHSALANTVVVVEASASSDSPNVCVQLKSSAGTEGADVSIYQRIENGEHLFWRGSTDATGKVCPPALPNGEYRIFASLETRDAALRLVVAKVQEKTVSLTMELVDRDHSVIAASKIQELELAPLRAWLKTFSGVVGDRTSAVIPGVRIEVWQKDLFSDKPPFETQTGPTGKFSLPLKPGRYVASIEHPGFQRCVFAFEVGERGWGGLRLRMPLGGERQVDSDFAEVQGD